MESQEGVTRVTVCLEFRFAFVGGWRGTLPSRSIRISELAENLAQNLGTQELSGKILSRGDLAPIASYGFVLASSRCLTLLCKDRCHVGV